MSGKFYEVSENRRRTRKPPLPDKSAFFARCMEVRMFNVGEGEVILLVFPGDRAWLIDAGCATYPSLNNKLAAALAKYLAKRGLLLEALVLSHPHTDHGLAFEPLLKSKNVIASEITYYRSADPYYNDGKAWLGRLQKQLKKLRPDVRTKVKIVKANMRRKVNVGGATVHLFAGKSVGGGYTSIFLWLRFGDARLLFTGDATCGYEIKLLKRFGKAKFRADVLKVTHHGASSGTASRLVCAVKPGICIASTAEDKGHRLEQDTLERLGGRPGPRKVLETLVDGDIIIRTDGSSVGGRVLYHVDRKHHGEFAKILGIKTIPLRNVRRGKSKHTNCEKEC